MDYPPYLTPKTILSPPKENTVATDSPIQEEEVVPRLEPTLRLVNTIKQKSGDDRAPEGPSEGSKTIKERDNNRWHDGSRDVIDDLHVDHRSTSVLPLVNILQEQKTNDGAYNQLKDETEQSPEIKNYEDTCLEEDRIDEDPDVSTYSHEIGELYAEDEDRHMEVLPDIVTPTVEVTIDDIQVGDPDVPLSDDQEQLRQLIWRNKNLLIGRGNALPPASRGAICDIDVGELARSLR